MTGGGRGGLGEARLGDEPCPHAVAIEAGAPEGETAELGERGGEDAGERDQKDRDHERAAFGRHRFTSRAPPCTWTLAVRQASRQGAISVKGVVFGTP